MRESPALSLEWKGNERGILVSEQDLVMCEEGRWEEMIEQFITLGRLIKLCGAGMGRWVEEEAKKRYDRADHHQRSELETQK